ncbi:endothelin-converting enzyme homolog isoform X2 [Asterias amurensis]|uniref:endothelin-converting enzyme homolog isoform X2 n=1 Tax=Asterias amurensis TaxID=7602 RepID=UPI003AB27CC4
MLAAVVFAICLVAIADGLPLEESRGQAEQGLCLDPECVIASGEILSAMDPSADPCDDFYRYACGGWLDKASIPVWSTSASKSFQELSITNFEIIKEILESKDPTTNTAMVKARDFYASCMDLDAIEQYGASLFGQLITHIGGWDVLLDDSAGFRAETYTTPDNIIDTLVTVSEHSQSILFNSFVGVDDKNSSRNIIYFTQPSLFLGPREYYLGGHDDLLQAYLKYGVTMAVLLAGDMGLVLTDDFVNQIQQDMEDIIQLEKQLAEIMMAGSELRDPFKSYHKMTLKEFSETIPIIDVFAYMKSLFGKEISPDEEVLVPTLKFFPRLNELLKTCSASTVNNYMKWQLIASFSAALPRKYRQAKLELKRVYSGIEASSPRWLLCASTANSILGYAVGAEFIKATHSFETKDEIDGMIESIRQMFIKSLPMVGWMDTATKALAREKAKAIVDKLIAPLWITTESELNQYYDKLIITKLTLLGNLLTANIFYGNMNKEKLGKPVDKTEWDMTPAEVNAYYNPQFNQIVFPAGILQVPFYSHKLPMSINYGAIGWVIGHELTHAFDNTGRKYDAMGNLHNWWKNQSAEAYKEHAQCIVDQYDGYLGADDNLHVNGKLTLGENIADNGGIRLSIHAYEMYKNQLKEPEKLLPGLQDMTPEQLFFIGAGQTWCRLATPEQEVLQLLSDPHSPGKYRVIGTFSNTEEFSAAFQCPPGSTMNPEEKCRVW